MAKSPPEHDFRTVRASLPDEVFAIRPKRRRRASDPVSEEVWDGIMHLPDHVALATSNHHGKQLTALYALWADWVEAIGLTEQDALFSPMLDAADCFQSSSFDSLHGYYRSALSNLRSALELVAIGTLGNLRPTDEVYARWKKSEGSLAFPSCRGRLRGASREPATTLLFKQDGWIEKLYYKLCNYAHSRPDSSDGAMWESNGPIYVGAVFNEVFRLQASTYAACYILVKVGRPQSVVLANSAFLFGTPKLLWSDDMVSSYITLCKG